MSVTISTLSLSGGSISGGYTIIITGNNFIVSGISYITSVNFGNNFASKVNVIDNFKLTCTVPKGSGGIVNVYVTNSFVEDSNSLSFTYYLPPFITLISPSGGYVYGGILATITGSNFLNYGGINIVYFGKSIASNIITISDTKITCIVPCGLIGSTNVYIDNSINGISNYVIYVYTSPSIVTASCNNCNNCNNCNSCNSYDSSNN